MNTELRDEMQQTIVPRLYSQKDSRILDPNANLEYEGGSVKVVEIAEDLSVIVMAPEGLTTDNAQSIFIGMSGYTMPPTSIMGDKLTQPLMAELKAKKAVAIFLAPYGRGSRDAENHQGRWTAEMVRDDTAIRINRVLESLNVGDKRIDVGVHSLAGQSLLRILAEQRKYGVQDRNWGGLVAWCPAPPKSSQLMWRSAKERLGFNWPLITGMLPHAAWPIVKAVASGNGVMFDPATGKKLFFDGENFVGVEQVVSRLFGDSWLYFLQALTVGSTGGRINKDSLLGINVGLMGADGDSIITDKCMGATRAELKRSGANVFEKPAGEGGHFMPFLIHPEDTPQTVSAMKKGNSDLLKHAMGPQLH